jgi:Fe-S oxidoreductase/nitrate reductase gamma subunit/nitrate/TMAO reductase-like tetraheme cytochrome c subunit
MNRILVLTLCGGFLLLSVDLPAAPAYETEDCIRCHGEASRQSRLRISAEAFRSSVHGGGLGCQDCHAGVVDDEHVSRTAVQPVDCNPCHDQVNRHGEGGSSGRRPACHDCHTKHAILPPTSLGSSVHAQNLKHTCAACHPKQSGRIKILASVLTFQPAGHRKGNLSGVYDRTRCVDCHQGQAAHGEKARLNQQPCGECHSRSVAGGFLLGPFHGSEVLLENPRGWLGQCFYFILLLSGSVLLLGGLHFRGRMWRSGRQEDRSSRRLERLASLLVFGLGQKRVFEDRFAGFSHAGIVIGFVVPLVFVLAVQVPFDLPRLASDLGAFVLDLSGLCGIAGVLAAALRRARRQREGRPPLPGNGIVLGILLAIFSTGFLVGAARNTLPGSENVAWAPVRFLLARWVSPDPVFTSYAWRLHFLLAVGLVALLPYGKIRHVVTAPLNIYHRNLGAVGALTPLVLRRGAAFGASHRREFSWKQLLDADACMECGRCERQCPATASGKPLSPRKVIEELRRHMEEDTAGLRLFSGKSAGPASLIGGRISDDEIWACTTCHACQFECPVSVEQPRTIVDLRRHLVLTASRFPAELKPLFRRLEIFGDTYGKGPARRTEWAKGLKVDGPAEYLLWIGCEGSFHSRYREVSGSLIRVLSKAGLDFGILGKEERCCGDLPRRLGNEYLFQSLAEQNIGRIQRRGVKKIVTLCPHCFHALRNEYPPLGGDFAVCHYTELLWELVSQGRLKLKTPIPRKATYQDPCYLGRVNGQFQAPRSVLAAVPGLDLVEMGRSCGRAFCCGAGGGRVWMHEHLGKRINRIRAEEAVAVGAEWIITSCPYCLSMFDDALGSMSEKNLPQAADLAEFVMQSIG